MKKINIPLLLLLVVNHAISQMSSSGLPGIDKNKHYLQNPSISNFNDFSNSQLVDLYTGMVDVNIPIYQIKSGDLKFDLTLSYRKDGILVEEDASWVGLGWQISGVSYIKREIKGNPDEAIFHPEGINIPYNANEEPFINYGRFRALDQVINHRQEFPLGYTGDRLVIDDYVDMIVNNDLSPCKIPSNSLDFDGYGCQLQLLIRLLGESSLVNKYLYWNSHEDTQPDIFHYFTPTASGSFVLDKTGKPRPISGSTDVIIKPGIGPQQNANGWEIISPDGIKYTFPNSDDYTETTLNSSLGRYECAIFGGNEGETKEEFKSRPTSRESNPIYASEDSNIEGMLGTKCLSRSENEIVKTWYLSKIKSSKYDKEINFEYESEGPIENYQLTEQKLEYIASFEDTYTEYFDLESPRGYRFTRRSLPTVLPQLDVPQATQGESFWHPILKTIKNPKYLKLISFSEGTVAFEKFHNDRLDMPLNKALEKIRILDKHTNLIKEFKFNYQYFSSEPFISNEKSQRLKLISFNDVTESQGTKSYSFEYDTIKLPSKGSYKQDYWGYYNNNTENSLIPGSGRDGVSFSGANRNPDSNKMKAAMLKKIHYPTGGYAEIIYGQNETDYVDRIGGLKVNRIIRNDGVSAENNIKNYFYDEYKARPVTSSMNGAWYKHFQHDAYFTQPKNLNSNLQMERFLHIKRSSHNIFKIKRTKGGLVGYGKVTESTPGNGKIVYEFTNASDYPDRLGTWLSYPLREELYDTNHARLNTSYEPLRGLLKSIKNYNEAGELTSSLFNEYEEYPANHDPYSQNTIHIKRVTDSPAAFANQYIRKLHEKYDFKIAIGEIKGLFPYLSKSTYRVYNSSDHDNSTYVEKVTKYEKNSHDHMQLTGKELLNKDTSTLTRNSMYYSTDVDSFYDLTDSEIHALSKLNDQNRLEPILIEKNEKNKVSKKRHLFERNENNTEQIVVKEEQFSKGNAPFISTYYFNSYDSFGNLVETSKLDGTPVYYIWGYNKERIIARIENFNSMQAAQIQDLIDELVTISDLDNDRTIGYEGNEGLLRRALDDFRVHPILFNANVLTYTYDPMIGITSMTDPRGQTTYYHYDEFNRLQFVKDAQGNVLNKNEYHFKN